jgi:hypothetical protein
MVVYPFACIGLSRSIRRILSSRKEQEEVSLRFQPLQVGEAHGPIHGRRRHEGAEPGPDPGVERQPSGPSRGGRAESRLERERLNPCWESTSFSGTVHNRWNLARGLRWGAVWLVWLRLSGP